MLLSLIKKITSSSSSNEAQTNTVNNTQTVQVVNPDNQELSDGKYDIKALYFRNITK